MWLCKLAQRQVIYLHDYTNTFTNTFVGPLPVDLFSLMYFYFMCDLWANIAIAFLSLSYRYIFSRFYHLFKWSKFSESPLSRKHSFSFKSFFNGVFRVWSSPFNYSIFIFFYEFLISFVLMSTVLHKYRIILCLN